MNIGGSSDAWLAYRAAVTDILMAPLVGLTALLDRLVEAVTG